MDEPSVQRTAVVCDTNVLVSAVLFPRSVPGQAVSHARRTGRLLTTPELATELQAVLMRPKFDRYITANLRDEFIAGYLTEAEFVVLTLHTGRGPMDSQDTHVATHYVSS